LRYYAIIHISTKTKKQTTTDFGDESKLSQAILPRTTCPWGSSYKALELTSFLEAMNPSPCQFNQDVNGGSQMSTPQCTISP
jgi:hypothetical protein